MNLDELDWAIIGAAVEDLNAHPEKSRIDFRFGTVMVLVYRVVSVVRVDIKEG